MLKQELLEVLNKYISNKKSEYKDNTLAKLIRKDLPKTLEAILNNGKIKVKGSCGQGQWAEIPWIAFLHSEITKSTQDGCFVVYLFKANMEGVYISLNQGWQFFDDEYGRKEGLIQIANKAKQYKKNIDSNLGNKFILERGVDLSSISLGIAKDSSLPKGYELGHICGKYYSIEDFNAMDNDQIINDLKKLIDIYSACVDKGIFVYSSIDTLTSDINAIENDDSLNKTTKNQLIESRLGQGKFREKLICIYPECPVTGVKLGALLRASHIKPWRACSNDERLDPNNGFMLAAHVDALFDKGYLSFEDDGSLLISRLCLNDIDKLYVDKNTKIKINEKTKKYLQWHRENIFIK